jgi:hypothetical protein
MRFSDNRKLGDGGVGTAPPPFVECIVVDRQAGADTTRTRVVDRRTRVRSMIERAWK